MGIATHREERLSGKKGHAAPCFEPHHSVDLGGLLFLLPCLIQQGLLKARDFYTFPSSHYYGVESIVLTLAFMALARIKNPESLKHCKPGELGRLIGLDRVPEVKCLRNKISLMCEQQQAACFNQELMKEWCGEMEQADQGFYYVDGHQRIYYGHKANLPSKYIARQKLCLSATTEFWVNDAQGQPLMMVIGALTEKLQEAILELVLPQMMDAGLIVPGDDYQKDTPQCTLVFDREAYSPTFFDKLWEEYRISFVTYRKNVTDEYPIESFHSTSIEVLNTPIDMLLCECCIQLGNKKSWYREVRRRTPSGHQIAIITNHPTLSKEQVAQRMFSRWTQENFFKYLISDYDFDKVISFGIEPVDREKTVVNPLYRKLTHRIKKLREKISRLESKFYPLLDQWMEQQLEQTPQLSAKYEYYQEQIAMKKTELDQLLHERKQHTARIKVEQMPENKAYNKLTTESKKIINLIRMIAYRAETAVANSLCAFIENKNAHQFKRMIVKQIIQTPADIIPDYQKGILNVKLHHLSAPRYNQVTRKLAELLNQTKTVFPGTELILKFYVSD